MVADSVVLLFRLGALPPRVPCEPKVCVLPLPAVFFSFLLAVLIFSTLPSLFRLPFGQAFVFILSFSCGYYAVSSVSVSAATRLAYSYDTYLDAYVR